MTALAAGAPRTRTASAPRLSFARVLRSEWVKLSTLRSTWWSIGIVAVLTVGIATLLAQAVNTPDFPPMQIVVAPIQFTMLLAGILGAISVTGEYATGMIRSTLAADPRRGSVLAGKAIVVAAFLFAASFAIFLVTALVVTPILAGKGMTLPWDDVAAAWLPLISASFSMAVFALIGVAFGFLLRSGAGAIAATVGVLFVLPLVVSVFPSTDPAWKWVVDLGAYLPMSASQNLVLPQDEGGLSAPVALVTLCGWVVAGMLAAWTALRVRDA
ncbi:MAG: ABC transporter permease subunit [Microbacterium sp.]